MSASTGLLPRTKLLIGSLPALLTSSVAVPNQREYIMSTMAICACSEERDSELDALCAAAMMQLSPWDYHDPHYSCSGKKQC